VAHYDSSVGFPAAQVPGIAYINGHTLFSTPSNGLIHFDKDEWAQYGPAKSKIPERLGRLKVEAGKVYILSAMGLVILPDFADFTLKYPAIERPLPSRDPNTERILFVKNILSSSSPSFASSSVGMNRLLRPDYVREIFKPDPALNPSKLLEEKGCIDCHHEKGWGWRIPFAGRKATQNYFSNPQKSDQFFKGKVTVNFPDCTVNSLTSEDKAKLWKWLMSGEE
jgi:hypothetical protein